MEIYVRFNSDVDHDYAFQLNQDDTVDSKIAKIFSDDPAVGLSKIMVLKPTIFHKHIPSAYYKSTHPGYLTEGGCLIFHYGCDSPANIVKLDTEKPLFSQLWPGQLIVPQWEKSYTAIALYSVIMLAWLYTDLPDVVSPTPGICLTNQLSRMIIPLAESYGHQGVAEKLREEVSINFSSFWAQWGFFAVHILKVAFVTLCFITGMANPISYNPIRIIKARTFDVQNANLKKVLQNLGWLGTRRANYDDYQTNFYSYILEKFGSPRAALKANMIRVAAHPGFVLSKGEGFQTPLEQRFTGSTFKTMDEKKAFVLSEEYFVELEKSLKHNIDLCNGDIGKMNNEIRRFRRFGLYEPSDKIVQLVNDRRSIDPKAMEIVAPFSFALSDQEPKKEK